MGTYLLALAAAHTNISRNRLRRVPFYVVTTSSRIMTAATLQSLSLGQAQDSLIVLPPQHPRGLCLAESDPEWIVLSDSEPTAAAAAAAKVSTGVKSRLFSDFGGAAGNDDNEGEEDRLAEERVGMDDDYYDHYNSLRVDCCHLVDPKTSTGVVLEGRSREEVTNPWAHTKGINFPILSEVSNVYSEVNSELFQTFVYIVLTLFIELITSYSTQILVSLIHPFIFSSIHSFIHPFLSSFIHSLFH